VKAAIFSALVWAASSAFVSLPAVAHAGTGRLLQTLHGWAIAAFVITVALHLLQRRAGRDPESFGTQAGKTFAVFALFSSLVVMLIVASASSREPLAVSVLVFAGGVVAPVVAVMALEFSALRPRALAACAIVAACLGSAAFIVRAAEPSRRPGIIRSSQPANAGEQIQFPTKPARA